MPRERARRLPGIAPRPATPIVVRGTPDRGRKCTMTLRFSQWTLDVQDVERMADFWSHALGYRTHVGRDGVVHLDPDASSDAAGLTVYLQPCAVPKRGKNRDHPDFIAHDGDVKAEVQRLLSLGATRADVGQSGWKGFKGSIRRATSSACCIDRAWVRPGYRLVGRPTANHRFGVSGPTRCFPRGGSPRCSSVPACDRRRRTHGRPAAPRCCGRRLPP